MKTLLILLLYLLVNRHSNDGVNLRVYNNSKYFVKEYAIVINGNRYSYENISPNSYSSFKSIPLIYEATADECTVLVKPFLGNGYTVTLKEIPIDHTTDVKMDHGSATLTLNIEIHHKHLNWRPTLKQE